MTNLQNLAYDLKNAQQPVFLTGAGVSTASGIPDYRSKKQGLYTVHHTPEQVLSHDYLSRHPKEYYQFVMDHMYFPAAQPNIIHRELARYGKLGAWTITQNVDGLDIKAGNPRVVQFHGNLYDLYCQKCGQTVSFDEYQQSDHHALDGGIIRGRVVLYGEAIDPDNLRRAQQILQVADMIVIVGTSFQVYPFAQLVSYRQAFVPVYVINQEPTILNQATTFHLLQEDATTVFTQLKQLTLG